MIPTFDIPVEEIKIFIFDHQIKTPDHYTRFGRPYWHVQSSPYDSLVSLAAFKIRGGLDPSVPNEKAMLAGLCIL